MARLITDSFTKNIDESLFCREMSSEECLLFFADPSNWNNFNMALKKAFHKHRDKNASIDDIVKSLTDDLYKLESERDPQIVEKKDYKKNLGNSVRAWCTGKTQPSRESLFKLCFALGLDLNETIKLLERGRISRNGVASYAGFNVRNAREATIMYCIKKKLPYSCVKEIMDEFDKEPAQDSANSFDLSIENAKYTNTTYLLLEHIINDDWKNEDSFLNEFLVPNKNNFINYSKTALREYKKQRRILMATIALRKIAKERDYIVGEKDFLDSVKAYDNAYVYPDQHAYYCSSELIKSLMDERDANSVIWQCISQDLNGYVPPKGNQDEGITRKMRIDFLNSLPSSFTEDIDAHFFNSLLFSNSIPHDMEDEKLDIFIQSLFRHTKEGTSSKSTGVLENHIRTMFIDGYSFDGKELPSTALGEHPLYERILHYLPHKPSSKAVFAPYNADVSDETKIYSDEFRNALIYMFFINYFCDKSHENRSFREFHSELNGILERSAMPYLYCGYPFDCLIMYCAFLGFTKDVGDFSFERLSDILLQPYPAEKPFG